MRINKLKLPFSITQAQGLEKINIERLGPVVALVGRNGSGKSRILNLIENSYVNEIDCGKVLNNSISLLPKDLSVMINSLFDRPMIKDYFQLEYRENELARDLEFDKSNSIIEKEMLNIQRHRNLLILRDKGLKFTISHISTNVSTFSEKLKTSFKNSVRRINYEQIRALQQKLDEKAEQGIVSFERLVESVGEKEENYNEFNSIHGTALNYMAKLPHQLVIDKDEAYGDELTYEEKSSFKRFNVLKKLMKNFLNKELGWEKVNAKHSLTADGITTLSKGIWKLNGRLFDYRELSDGEKTLFAYCLLFFLLEMNPNIKIKESIIIIDEPELHLHPESELWLINGIRNVISEEGQLWIATHSISILSSLNHDEIFMVKDGEIHSPNKSIPGKTLTELMGLEAHIERLNTFMSDISSWAYINFMSQCFMEPEVIRNAQPNDPEVEVFFKGIMGNKNASVLLDFGAGNGRVLRELQNKENSNLKYYALEPNPDNQVELAKLSAQRVYTNYSELPVGEFDYILMCNVLHEIPVTEWENLLNKIYSSLKKEGYILFIEDLKLPKGERVEKNGFVILDQESLEIVFQVGGKLKRIYPSEEKYKDRILCLLVPKLEIGCISKESVKSGVEKLKKNVYDSLKKLRAKSIAKQELLAHGRTSAFYSQLYINTVFALEALNKK